jgi:TRAP-type mannitol/chloroaromatic compound transport system permease small subunit
MNRLMRTIDWISEYSGRTVSLLILPLILTIVYSVTVRYAFNAIVHWSFEMTLFMNGILVMTGGAYALKHQSHVRVDVLSHYIGPRGRNALDILSFATIILVCCLITYIGTRSAWGSTLRLERSPLQTPFNPQIWWFRWLIPFSATLIALQALAEIIRTIRGSGSEPQGNA